MEVIDELFCLLFIVTCFVMIFIMRAAEVRTSPALEVSANAINMKAPVVALVLLAAFVAHGRKIIYILLK